MKRWLAAVLVLSGGALIALASPRLAAGLLALPGDAVLFLIENGRPIDPPAIDMLVASRRSVLSVMETSTARNDLGLALMLQAEIAAPSERAARFAEAAEQFRKGLSLAPARPQTWTGLAYAAVGSDPAAAAAAVHMAIVTGRADGPPFDGLLIARLRIALALFDYLPVADRELVNEQLRLAWRYKREEVIALVYSMKAQAVLRAALPDEKAELDRLRL